MRRSSAIALEVTVEDSWDVLVLHYWCSADLLSPPFSLLPLPPALRRGRTSFPCLDKDKQLMLSSAS